tara:strand:- start:144 stop:431 length:288 start_codon:yes stop_codon:yes gene_type:complete
MENVRILLLIILGVIQLIMAFFTIRLIVAKMSNNQQNGFYFKERRDYISPFSLILTFAVLIIIFFPKQEKIEFTTSETKLLFGASILGLLNNMIN